MPNKHTLNTNDLLRPFLYALLFLEEIVHEMSVPKHISFDRRSA